MPALLCRLRSFAALSLMVLGLLLVPLCARAGSYGSPVYSGGATTATGPTDNTPGPYSAANAPSGSAWGGGAYNHQFYGPQSVSIHCQGAITATFTWNGGPNNDPAPAAGSVVVVEQVYASWGGNGGGSVGSDIPGGTITGGSASQVYTAARYSAQGGASISVTCTPTASASSTAPAGGSAGVYANVGYTAAVSPVTLTPQGAALDSSHNYDILVGQGCTGILGGIPDALLSNKAHLPTYSWTISGTTFQDWELTTPAIPPAPANANASYYVAGSGSLTNSTAYWFWNDLQQTQETVKCTATVTPPAGQGSAFSVTPTQKVTVQVPLWDASGVGGRMEVNANAPGQKGAISLWAGPGVAGGMSWTADSYPPQSSTFGMGTLALVQLITPSESYVNTTGVGVPGTTHPDPQKGQGLDGVGFYPWTTVQTGFAGDFSPYKTNDNPSLPLTSYMASAAMQNQFVDYLMYQPPDNGNGIRWVPLSTFTWSTNGSATNPGNWANYATIYGSDGAGTVNPSATTLFTPGNTFPSWTQVIGPVTLPWPSS